MSLEISATPANNSSSVGYPHVSMESMGRAAGRMDLVPNEPDLLGQPGLYSCVRGSFIPIDTKAKAFKKSSIEKSCKEAWEAATKFIREKDSCANEIEIKAVPNTDAPHRDLVTISYTDRMGRLQHISQRDIPPDLVLKMEKIRRLVRPNRNISPSAPLQIKQNLLPRTCTQFLETQFSALEATLSPELKPLALQNIAATEAMIQGFTMHLNGLIQTKKEELDDLTKSPLLPHIPRKKKEDDLAKLKELQNQLQSIDRYAVYWAIATWGNLKTGAIDESKRGQIRKTADNLSLNVKRNIQEIDKKQQDDHWIARRIPIIGNQYRTDPKELHAYALDAGDLLIADRWDYQQRRGETERSDRKTCIEQFIVNMMMNVLDPKIKVDEQHPRLAHFEPDTRRTIMELIDREIPEPEAGKPKNQFYFAKAHARAVHAKAGEILQKLPEDAPLASKLNALRAENDPQFRFQEMLS